MWPCTEKGSLKTSDDVLKRMAERYPRFGPLRAVKKILEELKTFDLPVGPDGRVRADSRPWAAVSGRNYPRVREFLCGLSKWIRHLIKPERGTALAYVDLRACEYGIMAAKSRDPEMISSYRSGEDVYLRLARLAGAVPEGATKKSHPHERALYKTAMLAAGYGQNPPGFAANTGCSLQKAEIVHGDLRRVYCEYFRWREQEAMRALGRGEMVSFLGWRAPVYWYTSWRFLFNFPIQSAGADILRTAAALMYDGGIKILALVQDAVLIEDSPARIEKSVAFVRECWRKASASVLEDGFELDSDADIVRWPHSFDPDKDEEEGVKTTWDLLMELRKKAKVS
jgi:DNA polymerase I